MNNLVPIVEPLNQTEEAEMKSQQAAHGFSGDQASSLKRTQQSRGLAERDEYDKQKSRTDHTLKPGDGTLPAEEPEKQTADANNFGASQAPQEEFIDQSN